MTTICARMKVSTSSAVDRREANRARSRVWWEQRRARGLCQNVHCTNQPEINPKTGEPYWNCRACRTKSTK